MKVLSAVCCVLVAAAVGVRASPFEHPLEVEQQVNEVAAQQRQLQAESSPLDAFGGMETLQLLLHGLVTVGSQLLSSFTADGVGQDMARALEETDPIELALNTIDLDTVPCRRRMACELRSGITSYTFGDVAYEFLLTHVPALQKYGRPTSRELAAPTCAAAHQCRYSNSPLMGTARSMRSLAGGICDMDGDSISSLICRAFTYVVDSLESL